MKKTILILSAVLLLTSCKKLGNFLPGHATSEEEDTTSTAAFYTPEEGEADDTEGMGLAPYAQEKMDISQLPNTATLQDRHFQYAVYVNVEQPAADEYSDNIYSVWLADERAGALYKICLTNPTAAPQWGQMSGENADAADVPIHLIATASKAYLAPGDPTKVIVEGCPDARNIWTYIIDTKTGTAKQFPSTEGVQELNWDRGEIILASYGYYPQGGRYTCTKAYSPDGKFLRVTSENEPE